MNKIYATVREARGALALDTGFDPFTTGHIKGRCTKAKLAEMGYVVNPTLAKEQAVEHRCSVCHRLVEMEHDGNTGPGEYPTTCPEHRKWRFGCDNGHVWHATDAEDKANGHKCPTCGEHWV